MNLTCTGLWLTITPPPPSFLDLLKDELWTQELENQKQTLWAPGKRLWNTRHQFCVLRHGVIWGKAPRDLAEAASCWDPGPWDLLSDSRSCPGHCELCNPGQGCWALPDLWLSPPKMLLNLAAPVSSRPRPKVLDFLCLWAPSSGGNRRSDAPRLLIPSLQGCGRTQPMINQSHGRCRWTCLCLCKATGTLPKATDAHTSYQRDCLSLSTFVTWLRSHLSSFSTGKVSLHLPRPPPHPLYS